MRFQFKMGTGSLGQAEVLWLYFVDSLEVLVDVQKKCIQIVFAYCMKLAHFANNALWQADLVELLLKEDWQTYVKNLDALILKACKLTDL